MSKNSNFVEGSNIADLVKNLSTTGSSIIKTSTLWLATSAIAVSGVGATVAISVYKCPVDRFLGSSVNLQVWEECKYTQVLNNAELNGKIQNLSDRKSTRLNSSHRNTSRMPSSA